MTQLQSSSLVIAVGCVVDVVPMGADYLSALAGLQEFSLASIYGLL